MTEALLILAGLFLLAQMRPTGSTGYRPPATAVTNPSGGTRITIPGIGSYVTTPGGGTSITVDPDFYNPRQVPSVQTGPIAQPTPTPDYQAWDVISAPIDVYPYDVGGVYAV